MLQTAYILNIHNKSCRFIVVLNALEIKWLYCDLNAYFPTYLLPHILTSPHNPVCDNGNFKRIRSLHYSGKCL